MGIRAEITEALLARVKEELDKGTGEIGTSGEKLFGRISVFHNFQSSLQIESSVLMAAGKFGNLDDFTKPAKPNKCARSAPSRDGILWRQF